MQRPWIALSLAAFLASKGGGAETISKQQCIEAHAQAQETRQNNKLRLAREHLKMCATASCPALVRDDCGPWLNEVNKQIPTLRVDVRSSEGTLADLRVNLDGETIAAGATVELDPGDHSLRVEAGNHEPHALELKVPPGKPIQVSVTLLPRAAPQGPEPPRPSRAAPLVLGGLGLVSLGAFAYLGATGKADEDELKKCKPTCDPGRVDEVSRRYLLANLGLGVGVVALGAATYLWLRKPAPARTTQLVPWVGPGLSGVGLSRSF